MNVSGDYVSLTSTVGSAELFAQPLDDSLISNIMEKTVTLSFLDDYGLHSVTVVPQDNWSITDTAEASSPSGLSFDLYKGSAVDRLRARFFGNNTVSNAKIYAVKLELGHLSTLARKDEEGNWVLNDPAPNFQQELAKCQRYYIALNGYGWIGSGQIDSGGASGQFFIPTLVTMRKVVPTISGNFRVYNSSNNTQVTNVVASGSPSNGINGAFNISGWNDSSGSSVSIWLDTNEILGISADL